MSTMKYYKYLCLEFSIYFCHFTSVTSARTEQHYHTIKCMISFSTGIQQLLGNSIQFPKYIMSYLETELLSYMNKRNASYSLFQHRKLISCSNSTNNQQFPTGKLHQHIGLFF